MKDLLSDGVLPNTLAIPTALLYIAAKQTIIKNPACLSDVKELGLTAMGGTVKTLDYLK